MRQHASRCLPGFMLSGVSRTFIQDSPLRSGYSTCQSIEKHKKDKGFHDSRESRWLHVRRNRKKSLKAEHGRLLELHFRFVCKKLTSLTSVWSGGYGTLYVQQSDVCRSRRKVQIEVTVEQNTARVVHALFTRCYRQFEVQFNRRFGVTISGFYY